MAPESDWLRVAVEAGIAVFSGVGGAFAAVWKWGRSGVKAEQAVKDDYDGKIDELREEMRIGMATQAKSADARSEALVGQFRESFEGLRRQMDDHRLDTEKRFLLKDDFREFLKEYRENDRRTDAKLNRLLETRQ